MTTDWERFKKAVVGKKMRTVVGKPESFGYLLIQRFPSGKEIWESPEGDKHIHNNANGPFRIVKIKEIKP